MWFFLLILIFSIFILVLSKYLNNKFKFKNKTILILFIIVLVNIIFFGGIIIIGHINEIKLENKFNELFQLYDKDHPDYGLLKKYDPLNEDEKQIYNSYFGDGGRKVFRYIIIPILCIFNIFILIILYFIIIWRKNRI